MYKWVTLLTLLKDGTELKKIFIPLFLIQIFCKFYSIINFRFCNHASKHLGFSVIVFGFVNFNHAHVNMLCAGPKPG